MYRFTSADAVGAALDEPKPECSFRTTTTISGSSAGANAANHAWSRSKYDTCEALSRRAPSFTTCAVPVLPAMT
ncbi:hypothetical protein PSR1_03873 [Anaeromyxobacter sp. PSR-1]|nr:hypothetical protein PSR1_03873 [Anaeromyxobacter sp. PSR-1]